MSSQQLSPGWWGGPSPSGVMDQGPWGLLEGRRQRKLWAQPCLPGLAMVSPLGCPTLLLCGGAGTTAPRLGAALFMWGNVWYVWYLGVYFPGCSRVPGVEMWLLHAWGGVGGLWWAWLVALTIDQVWRLQGCGCSPARRQLCKPGALPRSQASSAPSCPSPGKAGRGASRQTSRQSSVPFVQAQVRDGGPRVAR